MKKLVITIAVSIFLLFAGVQANAASEPENVSFSNVEAAMDIRDIGGEITYDTLYSHLDEPRYILGVSENGYLIWDTYSAMSVEWGTGSSPYTNYGDSKKYYGGILNYSVEIDDSLIDVHTEDEIEEVPYLKVIDTIEPESVAPAPFSIQSTPVVAETKILPNSYSYIQRRAFGYNNGSGIPVINREWGTCTAIATQICLNYLEFTHGSGKFVTTDMKSENLRSDRVWADWYPKADAMYNYLVYDCTMGTATAAEFAAIGVDHYRNVDKNVMNSEVALDWKIYSNPDDFISQIDSGRPAMIGTLGGAEPLPNGAEPDWHTMAVYGYRTYDDGSVDLLVHTGWDNTPWIEEDSYGQFYSPEVWIPASYASLVYWFDFIEDPADLLDLTTKPVLTVNSSGSGTSPSTLSWTPITNADKYMIYRRETIGDSIGVFVPYASTEDASYYDTSVIADRQYEYKVCAYKTVYGDDLEGAMSDAVAPIYYKPAAPRLTRSSDHTSITASWNSAQDAVSYELERSTNPNTRYELVTPTNHTSTSYTDKNLAPTTGYYYRLRVYYGGVYSDYSEPANVGLTIKGTEDDDVLLGSMSNDTMYGLEDNDKLYPGNGDDLLTGGVGDDDLQGGNGADIYVFEPR